MAMAQFCFSASLCYNSCFPRNSNLSLTLLSDSPKRKPLENGVLRSGLVLSYLFSQHSKSSFFSNNSNTKPAFSFNTIRCRVNHNGTVEHSDNGLSSFPEKHLHGRSASSSKSPPPRPRRIILVRHGQSEGNVDESAYTRISDPKIGLTEKGLADAEDCGRRIREMIEGDKAHNWKVYFDVSPYRRTVETFKGLGTAFERSRIAGMRVEPRLREQDFGNFQDREKMRVEKAIRMLYGRFFYRFPNGESAADVYDRITGFRETLRSDIDIGRFGPPGERNPNINLVLVSHGLTLRVFLMRWYKWTVVQFERLNNFGNGGMVVMERGYGGRYSLLMHHTEEELRQFGMTDEMLVDQEWQKYAKPGELNYDCPMLNSFFTHFADGDDDGNRAAVSLGADA